ncbi:hypothetical protein HF996_03460 [Mycoplasma sp. 1654_15]|nr:hypothetical protein HF996_03460 [Mycoplasma sp. 1654_15]
MKIIKSNLVLIIFKILLIIIFLFLFISLFIKVDGVNTLSNYLFGIALVGLLPLFMYVLS